MTPHEGKFSNAYAVFATTGIRVARKKTNGVSNRIEE